MIVSTLTHGPATQEIEVKDEHRRLLEQVVGDPRHAYLNLIRPEDSASWDITQRTRLANGLLAPQIVRLEDVLNDVVLGRPKRT